MITMTNIIFLNISDVQGKDENDGRRLFLSHRLLSRNSSCSLCTRFFPKSLWFQNMELLAFPSYWSFHMLSNVKKNIILVFSLLLTKGLCHVL